jgi:OTU-like cysteine protease
MAEYYTEELPDFDVGAGRYTTRNARYRAFVCQHFELKHVSVGGDGNCFFEALSLMLQPQCSAAQLRANCVDLFKQSRESTQVVFERIQQGIEDELHRELVCSKRGSRIDGLKPASVPEYIDAVSHDGVWVQGLHWIRAVSFLYDVRICVVIYGQQFVRFVGTGTSTVYLYNVDGTTQALRKGTKSKTAI